MSKTHFKNSQQILSSVGFYSGKIDGLDGPKTQAAAEAVRKNAGLDWSGFSAQRKVFAAAQQILEVAGFEPGAIDGYWGHNTQNAFDAWLDARAGRTFTLDRTPTKPAPANSGKWPLQRDMVSFYGAAGSAQATAGRCKLPIPFVIAWNTSQKVNQFSCHSKVADTFTAVFDEAVRHYGEADFRRLRLDQFGGCYNNRNMRGGNSKSTHAFGVAVDLDPTNNQLRWNSTRASFARADYTAFWNVVEKHGLVSLGRERNFDWMHFQAARLS